MHFNPENGGRILFRHASIRLRLHDDTTRMNLDQLKSFELLKGEVHYSLRYTFTSNNYFVATLYHSNNFSLHNESSPYAIIYRRSLQLVTDGVSSSVAIEIPSLINH